MSEGTFNPRAGDPAGILGPDDGADYSIPLGEMPSASARPAGPARPAPGPARPAFDPTKADPDRLGPEEKGEWWYGISSSEDGEDDDDNDNEESGPDQKFAELANEFDAAAKEDKRLLSNLELTDLITQAMTGVRVGAFSTAGGRFGLSSRQMAANKQREDLEAFIKKRADEKKAAGEDAATTSAREAHPSQYFNPNGFAATHPGHPNPFGDHVLVLLDHHRRLRDENPVGEVVIRDGMYLNPARVRQLERKEKRAAKRAAKAAAFVAPVEEEEEDDLYNATPPRVASPAPAPAVAGPVRPTAMATPFPSSDNMVEIDDDDDEAELVLPVRPAVAAASAAFSRPANAPAHHPDAFYRDEPAQPPRARVVFGPVPPANHPAAQAGWNGSIAAAEAQSQSQSQSQSRDATPNPAGRPSSTRAGSASASASSPFADIPAPANHPAFRPGAVDPWMGAVDNEPLPAGMRATSSNPTMANAGAVAWKYNAERTKYTVSQSLLRWNMGGVTAASLEEQRLLCIRLWHDAHDGLPQGTGEDPDGLSFFDKK